MSYQSIFIQSYKKLYRTFTSVECRALQNEKVYFNSHGFNHLIRKGSKFRPHTQIRDRFSLLMYCPEILKSTCDVHEYRIVHQKDSVAHFWTIKKRLNSLDIKVVVRRINNGRLHFFSVMARIT